MTMKERIVNYMNDFGSITTKDAFNDLGCTRLSEYIRQIRLDRPVYSKTEKGINRYGEQVHWFRFYLKEDK